MKLFAVACALIVALCWGTYGLTLTNARAPADGAVKWGPFKPYLFIGMAYVVVALIGGSIMMRTAFNDNFDYSGPYFPAMKWGFLAGLLGAFGALGLTFALTKAGGKPSYVMPIVFGGAVTVNAIASYIKFHEGNFMMFLGMGLVVVGICLTAYNTPHGHPPSKPSPATADAADNLDPAPESPGGPAPAETS